MKKNKGQETKEYEVKTAQENHYYLTITATEKNYHNIIIFEEILQKEKTQFTLLSIDSVVQIAKIVYPRPNYPRSNYPRPNSNRNIICKLNIYRLHSYSRNQKYSNDFSGNYLNNPNKNYSSNRF